MIKLQILVFVLLSTIFTNTFTMGQDTSKCRSEFFDDPLLEKIIGKWESHGNIGNEKVKYAVAAKWILNHQFLEMTLDGSSDSSQYSAKVLIGYDCKNEKYVMHWLDIFGGPLSESLGYGKKINESIKFHFEYPHGPFTNEFFYNADSDSWQFLTKTKNNSNGDWEEFGNLLLKKDH